MSPPAAIIAAAWYAALPPSGSRTGCAPIDSARSSQQGQQRRVALERDRGALEVLGGSVSSVNETSGWKLPLDVPAAIAGASTDAGRAPDV